jgi:hypothetical protein
MILHQFPQTGITDTFSAELLLAVKSALDGKGSALISQHLRDSSSSLTLNMVQPFVDNEGKTAGVVILQQGIFPRPPDSPFWSEVTRLEDEGAMIWLVPTEDRNPMLDDDPAPT